MFFSRCLSFLLEEKFQKDKNKSTLHGVLWHIGVLLTPKNADKKACRHQIPPSCPKDFYVAQNGKHSDLTCPSSTGDTVMAVAADSHRDFLTPEHAIRSHARQRIPNGIQMNCVYSFAILFYHTVRRLSIPEHRKNSTV